MSNLNDFTTPQNADPVYLNKHSSANKKSEEKVKTVKHMLKSYLME
jgi:hypothetical protein